MPAAKLSTLSSSSRKLEEEEEVVYFRLRVYNYKLSSIYVLTRVCVSIFGWWVSQNTHKYKRWEIIFCNKTLYMFTLRISTYLIISFLNSKPRIKLLISIVLILKWFLLSFKSYSNQKALHTWNKIRQKLTTMNLKRICMKIIKIILKLIMNRF